MPDIVASQEFINLVNEFSPSYIVNIGGQSLLIDACSSIVPVLNINTVASDITMTEATALMIGRQPVRADADFLSLINKTTNYIIPGCFSFDIKKVIALIPEINYIFQRTVSFLSLSESSSYLGMQNDLSTIYKVCDLYLNPLRRGGGTSAVEAMYNKLPVVSINYGDVALNTGDEFCVSSYVEMEQTILK